MLIDRLEVTPELSKKIKLFVRRQREKRKQGNRFDFC